MNEIEKLYENAGVEPERQDCCKIADKYWANNTESGFEYLMQKECPYNQECTDECKYAYDKVVYPPFTAEKQLELIKWLGKLDMIEIMKTVREDKAWIISSRYDISESIYHYTSRNKSFEEALARLINQLWQDLTEEEKEQIRGILNGN